MPVPNADLQELNQTSAFIELYQLDASLIGGAVYHFTPNAPSGGGNVTYGGIQYLPMPIQTSGWDFTSTGVAPKPTLSISNINRTLLAAVVSLGDLVGAKVTRIRTFEKYLDDGASPSSTTYIGPDIFFIEQKTAHDNTVMTWQLTSVLDRLGMKLPRRQALRDPNPLTPEGFPGISRVRLR